MRDSMCSTSASRNFKLQSNQRFLRRVMSPESPTRNLLMVHGTGVGKCHGINTKILMFNGSIKLVQDVREGDVLMGDDSTPRRVLSLARGRDQMYEISSTKGTKYTVNSEHILCLKPTRIGVFPTKSGSVVKYTARYINYKTGKTNGKIFETKDEAEHYLDDMNNDKNYILEIFLNIIFKK